MTKFYKRIAAPASGKSYGAIRYIVNQIKEKSKRFVLTSISVDLCKDLHKNLIELAPDLKIDLIISDNTKNRVRVQDRYAEYLEDKESDIIIITHATLLNSYGSANTIGWDMVVDELPSIVQMKAIKGTINNDNISQWLDYRNPDKETGYREMMVKVGWENTLSKEITAAEGLTKEDTFLSDSVIDGLQGLLAGDTTILRSEYVDKEDGLTKVTYYFSHIHKPKQLWQGFGEVIFLCADFDNQLTGLLFKHKYKIPVIEKEEITLRATEYKQPERIKIYPLLMPPCNFTKGLSTKYSTSKGGKKYPIPVYTNLKEIFQHLVDVAETIVGDKGYIYTVNNFRNEQVEQGEHTFLQERDRVERLKYNPHGLNKFMDYNIALGLFHCNPSPYQEVLLKFIAESCSQQPEVFLKGYETSAYLDPIFQLVSRTAIRRFDQLEDIVCIVPDHRVATYLTDGWFKGAEVDYSHAITFTDGRKTNTRPPKFQALFDMNNCEKSAYSRWVKKEMRVPMKEMNTNDSKHIQLVTEWLETKRGEK